MRDDTHPDTWKHMRPQLRLSIACVAILVIGSPSLNAQGRLHGIVRDAASKAPLPRVEVRADASPKIVLTDSAGRYELELTPGKHIVRFRRLPYDSAARSVQMGDAAVQLDVELRAPVTRLDSVRVLSGGGGRMPIEVAERMRDGFGTFILDSALRQREHLATSIVIQSKANGVRFVREQGRNLAMARRGGASSGRCYMAIWVNGIEMWSPGHASGRMGSGPPPDLDQWSVVGLEAIEVYSVAQMPARYRGTGAACGVIALWLRTR